MVDIKENSMKVLMLNGSPRESGNTYLALSEMAKVFSDNGIKSEIVNVGKESVPSCMACGGCSGSGYCVNDDIVNVLIDKFKAADGFVVGTPTHFAMPSGALVSILQRMFYCMDREDSKLKVGAAVAVARRAGNGTALDDIYKYFTISEMIVVSGRYWNNVFGRAPGEVEADEEGMRNIRTVAANMAFIMKSVRDGKEKYGIPSEEERIATNFIR